MHEDSSVNTRDHPTTFLTIAPSPYGIFFAKLMTKLLVKERWGGGGGGGGAFWGGGGGGGGGRGGGGGGGCGVGCRFWGV